MENAELLLRLSQITTNWSQVFQAHQGQADAVAASQRVLMQRYAGAAYRYLLGIVRDADAADDLAQEFALRFLRGDFRNADPQRGRFRDFVKMALRHLVIDHHRRQKARLQPVSLEDQEPAAPEEADTDLDRRFLESWRAELLGRAWQALEQLERETGQPFHAVLRFRAEHPDLRSAQMAEQLSGQMGKPVSDVWVRQTLHRARAKYAEFLLEDVRQSLDDPTPERVAEELVDVGLWEYCRPRS